MLGLLTTLFSGGVTGLFGAVFTNIFDYLKRKQEHKQNLELKKLDIEMMDKEWQYRDREADREADVRMVESEDDLRAASYANDAATYSNSFKVTKVWNKTLLVLVDVIRGIIRPALTVMLIWMVWDIMVDVEAIISKAGVSGITADKAADIYYYVIKRIIFITEMCVTWWFGTRPKKDK